MTAIRGFARFLADDPLPDEERHDLADRILSNALSLQDLIDHLKSWALLESGRVELSPEPIPLAPFLADLVDDLAPLLGGRTVAIEMGDVVVGADPRGLARVLRNLLGNAARHTLPGDAIRISAHMHEGAVTVAVTDAGEGMPAELVPHVFDRFERGVGGGTGLGLAIVREYVELHGGSVSVESAPGAGATFRFSLPAPS